MDSEWIRIPVPIVEEADRRTLCAVLASMGLEVRIVRIRATKSGTAKRYVEYRNTGCAEPKTEA